MPEKRSRNPVYYVMIPISFVVVIGAMLIYGGFFTPDEEPPVEDNVPVEGTTDSGS